MDNRELTAAEEAALNRLDPIGDALEELEAESSEIEDVTSAIYAASQGFLWEETGPDSLADVKGALRDYKTELRRRTAERRKLFAQAAQILAEWRPCPKCRGRKGTPAPDDAGAGERAWRNCPRCAGAGVLPRASRKARKEGPPCA